MAPEAAHRVSKEGFSINLEMLNIPRFSLCVRAWGELGIPLDRSLGVLSVPGGASKRNRTVDVQGGAQGPPGASQTRWQNALLVTIGFGSHEKSNGVCFQV